jgi:hypothetical protein
MVRCTHCMAFRAVLAELLKLSLSQTMSSAESAIPHTTHNPAGLHLQPIQTLPPFHLKSCTGVSVSAAVLASLSPRDASLSPRDTLFSEQTRASNHTS